MNDSSLTEIFKQVTDLTVYPFQKSFFDCFFAEYQNSVVTAPTGSGKTWLAVFPFVYSIIKRKPIADRMFYVLPQRTLVTAVADTVRPKLESFDLKVTVQMGSKSEDPLFEGDVIVTTIDQLLSAYIGVSYGSPRSSSNIAPGALLGSYIVLDEFHLLETEKALSTFIDLTKRLKSFVRVLLMTATAPQSLVQEIKNRINGISFPVSTKEVTQLQLKEGRLRKRKIQWTGTPLTAHTVLHHHRDKTLVVVNSVSKAQNLYKELKTLTKDREDLNLVCLHARFLPEDRMEKQEDLKKLLSKESTVETIVIRTQVVEVGLDVSASVLITELCPASSLIQRIGRCARYGETVGKVYVHDLAVGENNQRNYLPYRQDIMDKTKEYLEKHSSFEVTAVEEEKFVETVHQNDETNILLGVSQKQRQKEVENSISKGDVSSIRRLVREVNNVQVFIHDDPDKLRLYMKPQRFSVPLSTLKGGLSQLPGSLSLKDVAFWPEFSEDWKHEEPTWRPIEKINDLGNHLMITLSPKVASYSKETGFILGEAGSYISHETGKRDIAYPVYSYKKESYFEHAQEIRQLIQSQDPKYTVFANRAAERLNISENLIHQWCELIGALHDVGKLNKKIVEGNWNWQQEIHGETVRDYLAHTDYDAEDPYQREKNRERKRFSHAPEGAFAVGLLLEKALDSLTNHKRFDDICRAMELAIKKHHNAFTRQAKPYELVKDAGKVVEESLEGLGLENAELIDRADEADFSDVQFNDSVEGHIKPERIYELIMYWHFVRRLRIADRKSQALKAPLRAP